MAWNPYQSLNTFADGSGVSGGREQTGFDSTGDLTPLARQLGWNGEGAPENWLRQQGYELVREDGLKGPNGRQASRVGALKDGQLVSEYLNEVRPEQSVGGLLGDIVKDFVVPAAAMYFGGNYLTGGGGGGLLGGGAPTAVAPAATGGEGLLAGGAGELGSVLTNGGFAPLGTAATAGAGAGFEVPSLFAGGGLQFETPSFLSSLGLNGRDLLQLGAFGVASAAQDRQADKNRDAALADRDALWARQDKLLADANAREDAKITDSRSYEQQRLDEARAYEEKLRQERFQRMKPATGLLAPSLVRKG